MFSVFAYSSHWKLKRRIQYTEDKSEYKKVALIGKVFENSNLAMLAFPLAPSFGKKQEFSPKTADTGKHWMLDASLAVIVNAHDSDCMVSCGYLKGDAAWCLLCWRFAQCNKGGAWQTWWESWPHSEAAGSAQTASLSCKNKTKATKINQDFRYRALIDQHVVQ